MPVNLRHVILGPSSQSGQRPDERQAGTVLAGHEGEYLDWFLRAGTADGTGIDPVVRDVFVRAYQGTDALLGLLIPFLS